MKLKNNFITYSIIWAIAIIYLIFSLYHNMGIARVINYTGIVRGATQKLVKQELQGNQNDELIQYLEDVLSELQTGEGTYGLLKNEDAVYQKQLSKMNIVWDEIKQEIIKIRNGGPKERLYTLSEDYFNMTNKAVGFAEKTSDKKVKEVIFTLILYLILSLGSLLVWNRLRNKEIHLATYIDPLTGLYNLAGFKIQVAKHIKSIPNNKYMLVDMDIDNFKYFNDTYSYEKGNQILITIANYLQKMTSEFEVCARIGSNNFILLLRRDNIMLTDFRKNINDEIRNELQLLEHLAFSTGAIIVTNNEWVNNIMDKANIALKSSKSHGGNHVVYYDEALMQALQRENTLINHMNSALENNEFKLYIQPKFNIHTQEIIGAEALVRWQWDDEIIMPDQFISLFEKKGFITELDFYMLKRTCAFIQRHYLKDKSYNIPISVNFSRVSLLHTDFIERFISILKSYQIPPQLIEVEITESAFIEIADSVLSILDKLKKYGVSLSMDDFGSGYSSLGLLITLPIDTLKLDKSFLLDKSKQEKTKKILSSLVDMAHKLELQVICEGVESEKDVKFLNLILCDYGQGYYYSRPIPEDEFSKKYLQ